MATSDERREVADRLRELPSTADADGCCTVWDVVFALGMKPCDAIGFVRADDAQRLADLIDRPTCTCEAIEHGRPDESHVCKSCSKCSYGWFEDIHDKPYSFCPNCGARVVETDD